MKKKFGLTALLVALMVLSVSVFTACGGGAKNDSDQKEIEQAEEQETHPPADAEPAESAEPGHQVQAESTTTHTAENAQAYVKAILDLMCTGDYDHSVNMIDIKPGEESTLFDNAFAVVANNAGINEELQNEFIAVFKEAYSKCRYSVGEAVPTEDGGYDVTVSIEPLNVYSGSEEKIKEKISERAAELDVSNMTDEDKNDLVYSVLIEVIHENLEEPAYGELQDVVVHYGLLDKANNAYGISAEESMKFTNILISTDLD